MRLRIALCIGGVALIAAIGVGAAHIAAVRVKQSVLEALGPGSEIGDVSVGFSRIVISKVVVKAPPGWPTENALSAERVVIVPYVSRLLSHRVPLKSLDVDEGYISGVRSKSGGKIDVLPGILGADRDEGVGRIHTIAARNCVIELFDQTVADPQRLRVEAVHGTLGAEKGTGDKGRTQVDLQGILKGREHQGTIAVTGWVDVGAKSSELTSAVREADLSLFQPYLDEKQRSAINQGTFNLDTSFDETDGVLAAHGTLVLMDLKPKPGEGPLGGLENIVRRIRLAQMTDKQDEIRLKFSVSGNIDHPVLSVAEPAPSGPAATLLQGLGLGFVGLIGGVVGLVGGVGFALGALI